MKFLSMTIPKIALKLGPFQIHWYAIFIVVGAILAVWLAYREAPKKKIDPEAVIDFILITFPIGLIGVRIYYVAFQWSYYSLHPSEIIALWDGGGAIYGGLIAGFVTLLIFCYYKMIDTRDFLDISIPGVFLAQAFGRWGNFVNQEAYGKIVNNLNYLPSFIKNQMFIEGHFRQPTFLFESIGTFSGFVLIIIFRHRLKFLKSGDIFAFYLVWYGIVRYVVEGMRTDSLMWGSIRVSQWFSLILVVAGVILIAFNHKMSRKI
ncbi:prolipoprotein diacylglyceryl transferase [Lactovum miscens]|uniref:Phosphatidylglycerol--prolipoprotein diacylglyceryl transferase n=1 Tax=Lactovum miscens TaxID=190387 RepID=A0A841C6Y1_9LACT|nr:prolipoprotein diacylglyceryl transferase [Lactovum miscens]MBB5888047.1 phosphatidylglycerol:prolipoprotein diacylglycerol transferase [Lactovum miscens]